MDTLEIKTRIMEFIIGSFSEEVTDQLVNATITFHPGDTATLIQASGKTTLYTYDAEKDMVNSTVVSSNPHV